MAPTLHLVRHAQGFHNLGAEFHTLPDPKLTDLGQEQCANLQKLSFPDQSRISLVTASPLTRTIHTASLTFKPALENGTCNPRIIALPDAQETSDYPCDTGSDVDVLTRKCADEKWLVDLSRLNDGWNDKSSTSRYSPMAEAIRTRAKAARQQIRHLTRALVAAGNPDPQVVLVTHGGYLHYFTEDWEDSNKYLGTGWYNCETRSYTFEAGIDSNDDAAHIIETQESRRQRGKSARGADRQEQQQLYQKSLQGWEAQGLQNPTKPATALHTSTTAGPSTVEEVKVAA